MANHIAAVSLGKFNDAVDGSDQNQDTGGVKREQEASPIARERPGGIHRVLSLLGGRLGNPPVEADGGDDECTKEDKLDAETRNDDPLTH